MNKLIITRLPIFAALAAVLYAAAFAQQVPAPPYPAGNPKGTANNGKWFITSRTTQNYTQVRTIVGTTGANTWYHSWTDQNCYERPPSDAPINGVAALAAATEHASWEIW